MEEKLGCVFTSQHDTAIIPARERNEMHYQWTNNKVSCKLFITEANYIRDMTHGRDEN